MSADLFAEFNELSNPPPSQQQQPANSQPQFPQAQQPFGHLGSSTAPTQVSQPWGGFPNQPAQPAGWAVQSSSSTAFAGSKPPTADEDDGWGDFEVADTEASKPSAPTPGPWEQLSHNSKPAAPHYPMQGHLVRASTMDIMSNNLGGLSESNSPKQSPIRANFQAEPLAEPRPKFKQPSDPNILFDAQEFELEGGDEDDDDGFDDDDDDFGDFETVTQPQTKPAPTPFQPPLPAAKSSRQPPQPPQAPPSMDLLSLDDPPLIQEDKPKSAHKASASLNFGATKIGEIQPAKSVPQKAKILKPAQPKKPAVVEDDEWAAWDDYEPPSKKKVEEKIPTPSSQAGTWDWDSVDTPRTEAPPQPKPATRDDQPPPINVPPPSVLLSAFPALFSAGSSLFKPAAGQNASIKQRILSDPKAVEFLQGYILIAITAARVIAGRKHRWHRDKILAKSMSISAAGSKGMKLAGVDKTQSVREDREAADVVDAWREHVGRLRSAVAAANSAGKASLRVPELSETMPVSTAKFVPTAPKPCVICGLKRDERVGKVDFEVEDSFGEWWVEHWGHRACKNFWIQHEEALRQR